MERNLSQQLHSKVMEFTEWDYFDTMKTNQVSISFNLTRLSATMENTQSYDQSAQNNQSFDIMSQSFYIDEPGCPNGIDVSAISVVDSSFASQLQEE